jgi:hypothetical protein
MSTTSRKARKRGGVPPRRRPYWREQLPAISLIHPRYRSTAMAREHSFLSRVYYPSARELFEILQPRVIAARPVIGDKKPRPGADGVTTPLEPIYGRSTYRNVALQREDAGVRGAR